MPMKTKCEECGEDVRRFKFLKKIGDKRYCKKCAGDIRRNNRKELIENSPKLKEDLKKMDKKIQREYRVQKKELPKEEDFPKIKGSIKEKMKAKAKGKSNCYMSLQDKQIILRILMSRGLDFEEAKERVKEIIDEQVRIRNDMKDKGKSEEDIKLKQQKMLEELWQ